MFPSCLSVVSIFLGTVYSIYNTDPFHWGFILGSALEFIHGKALFSEIYVQYGAGVPLLFKILGYVVPINYTTIGIITSVVYSVYFPILFACVERIGGRTHAIFITAIAFLVHPFATYPWPDYFAGMCMLLAVYFLLEGKHAGGDKRFAISGALLFLAFLFRNTYLAGIGSTIVVYALLALLVRSLRERSIFIVIGTFTGLSVAYLLFLLVQGNLGHWYVQDFGAGTHVYGIGAGSIPAMIEQVIVFDNLSALFVGLLAINAYMIAFVLVKRNGIRDEARGTTPGVMIFLCLLGCSGMSQVLHSFEIFRMQNSASPLYLGLAYFLNGGIPSNVLASQQRYVNVAFVVLIGLLITAFPYVFTGSRRTSALWPMIEPPIGAYSTTHIPLFDLHRFQPGEKKYYEDLHDHICDGKRKVVNLTRDSTIPYLCSALGNALSLPFYSDELLGRIDAREAQRVRTGGFKVDEAIVADSRSPLAQRSGLRLIGTVERPPSIRWMRPGVVSIYHVD
jgi:hypothetical protein